MTAKWKLVAMGTALSAMWAGCWAVTAVPGTPASDGQWAVGNGLALAAGVAFGAAWRQTA